LSGFKKNSPFQGQTKAWSFPAMRDLRWAKPVPHCGRFFTKPAKTKIVTNYIIGTNNRNLIPESCMKIDEDLYRFSGELQV